MKYNCKCGEDTRRNAFQCLPEGREDQWLIIEGLRQFQEEGIDEEYYVPKLDSAVI